ncbi:MAG: hypothetical protein L0211_19770 [Planctomycetaceae bacterium]|nr:hypothetical protein [Planctomycetaceae bacterium]
MDVTGRHSASTHTNDTIAYAASSASFQAYDSVGTMQVTGEANCITAIGATDTLAEVDTVISAMANVLVAGEGEGYTDTTWGHWATAALVETAFNVGQHATQPPVANATLRGEFWLFAHRGGDAPDVEDGARVDALIGASTVDVVRLGGGWQMATTIQQSSTANPTAAPLVDVIFIEGLTFDEIIYCTQFIPVPSQQPLQARIWDETPNDPLPGFSPLSPDNRIRAMFVTGDPAGISDFKAEADFRVTVP